MNYAIVFRLLGYILMIEGTLLLLPAVTSLISAVWAMFEPIMPAAPTIVSLSFVRNSI